MFKRIPDSVLKGGARAAVFLLLFGTLVLTGHGHPSPDADYVNAILHDDKLIVGWTVTMMLVGTGWGVASGSPMPTLEGAFFAAALNFLPQHLAHYPDIEIAAGALAFVWLASMFLRFGEAVIAIPIIVGVTLAVGAVMLPLWLVPRARRKVRSMLGRDAGEYVDYCVWTVGMFVGLPMVLLVFLFETIPATRDWAERTVNRIFDAFRDEPPPRATVDASSCTSGASS